MLNPWRRIGAVDRANEGAGEPDLRLDHLKREIALNAYQLDAGAVADEILRKLRLVRRGRAALAEAEAGRTPKPPRRPRRGR